MSPVPYAGFPDAKNGTLAKIPTVVIAVTTRKLGNMSMDCIIKKIKSDENLDKMGRLRRRVADAGSEDWQDDGCSCYDKSKAGITPPGGMIVPANPSL